MSSEFFTGFPGEDVLLGIDDFLSFDAELLQQDFVELILLDRCAEIYVASTRRRCSASHWC